MTEPDVEPNMEPDVEAEDQNLLPENECPHICQYYGQLSAGYMNAQMQFQQEMMQKHVSIQEQCTAAMAKALIDHDEELDDANEEQRQLIAKRLAQIDNFIRQYPEVCGGSMGVMKIKTIMIFARTKYNLAGEGPLSGLAGFMQDIPSLLGAVMPNNMANKSIGEFLGGTMNSMMKTGNEENGGTERPYDISNKSLTDLIGDMSQMLKKAEEKTEGKNSSDIMTDAIKAEGKNEEEEKDDDGEGVKIETEPLD